MRPEHVQSRSSDCVQEIHVVYDFLVNVLKKKRIISPSWIGELADLSFVTTGLVVLLKKKA